MAKQLDTLQGSGSRLMITTLVGAIWVISPFFGRIQEERFPGSEMLATAPLALLSAVVMVIIAWRAREARTKLNQQLLSIIVFAMLVQAAFVTLFYMAGGDLGARSVPVFSGFWFVISGVITVGILPAAWPMPIGYLTAAILAYRYPEQRSWCASLGNLTLVVTSLILFKREQREARLAAAAAK